jgi:hypothetical protein
MKKKEQILPGILEFRENIKSPLQILFTCREYYEVWSK